MNFDHLDDATRRYMLQELESDLAEDNLYVSPRLNENGRNVYATLLREAISNGNEVTLGDAIRAGLCLKEMEDRNTGKGLVKARIPETAAQTLAEGEFNRYYCRGLCLRAADEKIEELVIYRAKPVDKPRSDSEALIGNRVLTSEILISARMQPGKEASGIPHGPNSGLSVRFP